MTKIFRQPKQPKPARVTLAECRKTAEGVAMLVEIERAALSDSWRVISWGMREANAIVYHPSRSAALRIMHAALVAMRKEQKK